MTWYKEGHEPPPPRPPADDAHRLATIPRGDREELRVNLAEYEGRPYVSLRVWQKGVGDHLWPVRGKGLSVRVHEIARVVAALRDALDRAGGPSPPPDDARPRYLPPAGRPPGFGPGR